ncbi:GNAT family N-acetyltransferase [Streptomyces sp. NPDC006739]|uniref:GNAT family N-acetyltransferase n=1 Tax=Streptomyces sp. NPDC006739 TaxID=3364763 RepID=UPI0036C8A5DE
MIAEFTERVEKAEIAAGVLLRPLAAVDAEALCSAYVENRKHLEPWEPVRPEYFFTVEGQKERLGGLLRQFAEGAAVPLVMESADGRIVGAITLSGVSLGPFCSAQVGYWTAADQQKRGLAQAALHAVCRMARDTVRLHRIEASTLIENIGSQRVLEKCGFESIGLAPSYLHINGEWRDCRLFQRILHDRPPVM